jgi:chitinase
MKRRALFVLAVFGILLAGMSLSASAQTQACAQPWQVGMSITVGEVVSFGGHNWKAIQGGYTTIDGWQPPNTPALWNDLGPCTGGTPPPTPTPTPTATPTPPPPTPSPTPSGGGGSCNTPWSASTTYAAPGTKVSRNGINYQNAFWTMGDDPSTHSGPAGSGQPWIPLGSCSACTTLASAPGRPTASGTTFNSTNLSWPAVTAPANCSITGYTVLKNGSPIGTAAGTSFTVNGLVAQTTFNFSVEANDGAGSSAPSASVSVTTPACTGSCGGNGSVTFASYKDITLNADFNTGLQRSAVTGTVQPVTAAMPNQTLIWAFATGTCDAENWAGITPAQEATNVQAFVNAGKHYIISTGGANGPFDCSSGQGLINFINRYNSANLVGIDYDIELGQSQQLIDNLINATKVAQQQFPNLQFSFTIQSLGTTAANPITGGSVGTTVVNEIKRLGLGGNYVVNLMTFDYGSTNVNNCVVLNNLCDMGNSAIAAAQALNQQSGIPFNHIGITMMIGRADTQDEVTSLRDIDTISAFVISNGLAVSRFWSFDRDTPNGTGNSNSNGNGVPALAYTREFMNSLGVP